MIGYTEEKDKMCKEGMQGPGKADPVLFKRFPEPDKPSVNNAFHVFTAGETTQANLTCHLINRQNAQCVTI
jgi:hypothetical protein